MQRVLAAPEISRSAERRPLSDPHALHADALHPDLDENGEIVGRS